MFENPSTLVRVPASRCFAASLQARAPWTSRSRPDGATRTDPGGGGRQPGFSVGSKAVDLWFESEEKRIGEEYLADDNSGPVVIVFWYVTSPSTVYEVRGELLGQ